MTPEDMQAASSFVKDPTGFFSKNSASFSGAQVSQNPFGDYAPASTVIQGTLKNMYDTFTSSLESANADESGKQKSYEELMATKKSELATLQTTLGNKQTTLGETSKTLADSEAEKAATQKQLDDDEAFFEETKNACKSRADDWAERSRLRTEELAGINKAVEILTSDEASATFGRATSMFLQTSEEAEPKNKAYRALKSVARKYHSLRLAAIAATVKTTVGGHFDSVIRSIDKMVGELRTEEQDDVDHRDWCQEHENKFTNQAEDLEYKVGQTEALIERLEAKSGELETAIASTEAEILQTQETMAEALATRNDENADFKAALKDDTDAVALLASALDALTSFYKNNKLPIGLVQKQPEYAVDPDKAPPAAGGDKPYGGRSSETGGITGIISMIKEDLENEIKEGKAAEATAQAEYNEQRATALKSLAALKEKKTNQEMQKADTDQKTEDAEGVKLDTETMAIQKYMELDSIKPNCEWIKSKFDTRREARKGEIEGLITAKAVLAQKQGAEEFIQESTKSFLQKRMA
jgi:septal ring factor EnvC (AmiA/AmiB activator)